MVLGRLSGPDAWARERQRDEQAKLAARAERERITRELHDVVAYGLSVIVVEAALDVEPARRCGCKADMDSARRRHWYGVMGTVFSFVLGESVTEKTVRAVEAELNRIDRLFSTYRPDSQITRLNAGQIRLADCSQEVREVLAACTEAERRTAGWFTPRYSAGIDPTGIVKGWAVRRASDLLIAAGSTRHAINGGGDVLVVGDPAVDEPWRVGVPAGIGRGCPLSVITGHNFSVATSGNCERPGEIRSPVTGTPALTWSAFSVTGPDIVTADAFATAAVAMGRLAVGWLEGVTGYEGIAVDASGRVFTTAGVAAICPA